MNRVEKLLITAVVLLICFVISLIFCSAYINYKECKKSGCSTLYCYVNMGEELSCKSWDTNKGRY